MEMCEAQIQFKEVLKVIVNDLRINIFGSRLGIVFALNINICNLISLVELVKISGLAALRRRFANLGKQILLLIP